MRTLPCCLAASSTLVVVVDVGDTFLGSTRASVHAHHAPPDQHPCISSARPPPFANEYVTPLLLDKNKRASVPPIAPPTHAPTSKVCPTHIAPPTHLVGPQLGPEAAHKDAAPHLAGADDACVGAAAAATAGATGAGLLGGNHCSSMAATQTDKTPISTADTAMVT